MTWERPDHVHDWQTRSTHLTLEGRTCYQQCRCGLWRIMTGNRQIARIRSRRAADSPESGGTELEHGPPPERRRLRPNPLVRALNDTLGAQD
jgi:hypothetical protein